MNFTRVQSESFVKQYESELHHAEIAKKIVENELNFIKTRINEKIEEISMVKNPELFKKDPPKNFLASEKLASSKKKRSVSPKKGKKSGLAKRPKSVSRVQP